MNIKIKLLSAKTLVETIALVKKIFPYESKKFISDTITAGLDYGSPHTFGDGVASPYLRYWVAMDDTTHRIVGTTGLYTTELDEAEAVWVSWLCVDPKYRGQGIAKQLMEFTLKKAEKMNKPWLRVYTSSHPNELKSHHLYAKYGFRPFRPKKELIEKEPMIYLQRPLN